MAKSKRQIAQETENKIAETIADCYNDPLKFVLFTFPWGMKGTPLEHFPDGPDKWQLELFEQLAGWTTENIKRKFHRKEKQKPFRCAIKSGHGIGKSAMVSWLIMWLMSTRIHCRGVVTANTAVQLETKTWAELAKWHKMAINSHWFTMTTMSIYQNQNKETWKFDAVPWSVERTEAFAGLHNADSAVVMIFDEASAIDDVIWEVSEGTQTDGEPFWFAFGNPTRNAGRFFKCFNSLGHRWHHVTVDSREVRISNKELINEWIEDHGLDSDFVKVRVLGQFPSQGDKSLFNIDQIDAAMAREPADDLGAERILGIDPAGKGTNETRLTLREGRCIHPKMHWKLQGMDTMYVVGFIADTIRKLGDLDAVVIDEGGLGVGICDRLRQLGFKITPVNFGGKADDMKQYMNKRHEMYGRFREWLPHGSIPNDENLRNEMLGIEIKDYDQYNRFQLQTKEEMKKDGKKSPDFLDSIVLTFAYKIIGNDARQIKIKKGRAEQQADMEYDIYGLD